MKKLYMAIMTVLCSIGIAIAISYAWFTNSEIIDPSTAGYSASAYFAYGDGSSGKPYGIRTPRQLYNLAWLVYLDTNNRYKSCYYEIDANYLENNTLNMDGWVLPPIGTSTNPFLGHFDGQGAIIYKLVTSNNMTDFNNKAHPSGVSSISNCNNVGFFGVVGPTSGTAAETNVVTDFYLSNSTVKTVTSTTGYYFGIAAGYVNATMEDVGIMSAALNNVSQNTLSEYSVVGYATDAYLTTVNKKSTIIYNPTTTTMNKYTYEGRGTATGWGGSLDMLTMYKNLRKYWEEITYRNNNFSTTAPTITSSTIPYYTSKTITYQTDGTTTETLSGETKSLIARSSINSTYEHTVGSTNDVRFYDKSKTTSNGKTASIAFVIQPSNLSSNGNEWQFMCLTGYANRTMADVTQTITHTYVNAKFLTDGLNYLTYNNETTLKNSTTEADASKWYIDGNYYFTYPSFEDRTTKYYLTDDNGSLTLSTTKTTTWTNSNSTLKSSSNRYLVYESGWKLKSSTSVTRTGGYKIRSGTNYLSRNGDSINSANSTNATIWYVNSDNEIVTYNGSSINYLYCYRSGNYSYNYYAYVGDNSNYRFKKDGNKISVDYDGTRYIRYNNGFSVNTSSTSFTWDSSSESISFALQISNATYNEYSHPTFETPDTYYPLQSTNYGEPSVNNTGYLVSGAKYTTDAYGDIRVSAYPRTELGSNYRSLSSVRTINTIDDDHLLTTEEKNAFAKFDKSKSKLVQVLDSSDSKMSSGKFNASGTSYIFGLHFMNASIGLTSSQGHEVRIPYATINGTNYTNYQVPSDCINFNLKDKGFINFFAGTYYSNSSSGDNNSFFSLYEVYRDTNQEDITAIFEISKIYKSTSNENSYVYKYSNGSYSQPFKFKTDENNNYVYQNGKKVKIGIDGNSYSHLSTALLSVLPSGYTEIFDTVWITATDRSTLTLDAAYYFEIPVNDGEYALGSVYGKNGAYLMYLDIGANATEVYRSQITQKTKITTEEQKYPSGVSFVNNTTDDIDPRNFGVAKISTSGDHPVTISGTTITITGAATTSTYINPDVTMSNGTNSITASGTSPTDVIISQLMYVDYVKADTNSTYVTIITAETGKEERTSLVKLIEGSGVPEDQGGWGLFLSPTNAGDALISTESTTGFTINVNGSTTEKEKHYYYTTKDAVTTDTIMMVPNEGTAQNDGKTYSCAGDNIYITTDETIKVYVTQKDNLVYKFFFNLDMTTYGYPSTQTGVPVQIIAANESYEYEYSS